MTNYITPQVDQAVVVIAGFHINQPGTVVAVRPRTADVLLGRTGERVTVRISSLELY